MHAHLVFVTKFRHDMFTDDHLARTKEITRPVCTDFECELVEFNGETSHLHLLVNFPSKAAVAGASAPSRTSPAACAWEHLPAEGCRDSPRPGVPLPAGPQAAVALLLGRVAREDLTLGLPDPPTSPGPSAAPRSPWPRSTSNGRTCGYEPCGDAPRRHPQIRFTTGKTLLRRRSDGGCARASVCLRE